MYGLTSLFKEPENYKIKVVSVHVKKEAEFLCDVCSPHSFRRKARLLRLSSFKSVFEVRLSSVNMLTVY